MTKKLCWIVSNLDYSKQFDQLAQYLHNSEKYTLSYILLAEKQPIFYDLFKKRGIDVYFVEYHSKKDLPTAIAKIYRILKRVTPDIVHTNLFEATFAGLIAARLAGVKSRIHTRHHSNESHLFYPKRAIYYDKLINYLSTKIVAVSDVVAEVMIKLENVPAEKIMVIPHGFMLEEMTADAGVTEKVRKDYNLTDAYPVVGVVSRFVNWKGIQYVIPAFKKLLADHPKARLVMANARGNYSDQLRQQLRDELEENQYVIINIERRIFELFKTFDVFVHVPISREIEAYGQVYIEPLVLKVPSIFTLSGIANSFVEDGKNALVVPHENSEAIYEALKTMLADKELRERISDQGYKDVWSRYHINDMFTRLDELYSDA
jgi:glycosyltransferase involved in cell wall biosynthesis